MTTATATNVTKQYVLTALDRCDRCGAQAWYKIEMSNTFDLLFCKHDFDKNKVRLTEIAVSILDESDRLVQDKLKD